MNITRLFPLTFLLIATVAAACQSAPKEANTNTAAVASKTAVAVQPADAAAIIARKQVPILCYHQIRDWTAKDSKNAKDYICPIAVFKSHMKMLADSGYHTILPDQLYAYLTTGATLPTKPIMLTFDDTDMDQFTIADPELKKYHYKAVYFVMTVSLGRPHYMTTDMVKKLSDEGNIIGSHTWDHHMVSKYLHTSELKIKGKNGKITTKPTDDWITQIDKPTKKLEEITGKKMDYFAYPFGIWNKAALPELRKRGFKAAFQLAEKRDPSDPLMTIRRIIASGYWTAHTLSSSIRGSFK